jgi:hypothetical protein
MWRVLSLVAIFGTLALLPCKANANDLQSTDTANHAVIQNALYGSSEVKATVEPVRWRGYGWVGPRYYGGWYGAYRPYYGGYYYSTPYYSAYPYYSGSPYYSAYPYYYNYGPGVRVATPGFSFGYYR